VEGDSVTSYDEERLAQLIGALPPAPAGWIAAAQELPLARRGLDDLVARAEADAAFRRACLADLEAALTDAGYEPDPALMAALRRRLSA
jgi:hypothetical protein